MSKRMHPLLIVGIVVGLIVGVMSVNYFINQGQPGMSVSVELHDSSGNLINTPMAIYAGNAEVYSMTVKVAWIVSAIDIDPTSFNAHVRVDLAVKCLTNLYEQLPSAEIDNPYTLSADDPASNWNGYVVVGTWVLSDLLSEYMTDAHKTAGWSISINAELTPTATDVAGNPVLPDPPTQNSDTAFLGLTWVTTTATMTIVSFETERWADLP